MAYGWGLSLILLAVGMLFYIRMPVSEAYIISHTPERCRSTVLGIYYFGSRGGPGALIPVLGYLSDHIGFSNTFSIIGVALMVVATVCSLLLWRNRG